MKIPNSTEIVLLLIGINKRINGKTILQKNIFLLKEMSKNIELPFVFRPYFYGPYSDQVTDSLNLLENIGLLCSTQVNFGIDEVFEIKQTCFEVTPAGNLAYENIKSNYPEFTDYFIDNFNLIKSTGFHQNTRILSTAAKIKLILSLEKKTLSIVNIKSKAKQLGWNLDNNDINSAIAVLTKTKLAQIM